MRRTLLGLLGALVVVGTLGACGGGDDDGAGPGGPGSTEGGDDASGGPTSVTLTAKDFGFDVPATIQGGLVRFSFSNAGQEPHFAAFADVAPGKTFDDVKAVLTAPPSGAPPSGPPPFEDVAGFPTTDPGGTGSMTLNLPPGSYIFYCAIPSPDGVPHAAKGMMTEVAVTEGAEGELPGSLATISAIDFVLSAPPPLMTAGITSLRLHNAGKQLHEINLVELGSGKTIDDVVAWYQRPAGPPPMRSLAGVAVKPGVEATTELDLKAGPTYAFICGIPDFLGDFAPHITKGMRTETFSVG